MVVCIFLVFLVSLSLSVLFIVHSEPFLVGIGEYLSDLVHGVHAPVLCLVSSSSVFLIFSTTF